MADVEKQITKLIVVDQASKLSDLAIGHQQIIFIDTRRTGRWTYPYGSRNSPGEPGQWPRH